MEEQRYYYKTKDGKGIACLKHPLDESDPRIEITKEEYEQIQQERMKILNRNK